MMTEQKRWPVAVMTRMALLAALLAVVGPISIPLPFTPVPVTLQTLSIMLCAALLTPAEALGAVGIYILLGIAGLPVFSKFAGGLGVLAGPTGGFIAGFLPAVWVTSRLLHGRTVGSSGTRKVVWRVLAPVPAAALFLLIIYTGGVLWGMISLEKNISQALAAFALPFLPFEALKAAIFVCVWPALGRLRRVLYRRV